MVLVTAMTTTAFAASKTNRISVRYVTPKNPAHQEIYTDYKQLRSLEKLQKFLSPIRLPETLRISVAECDGESEARRLIAGTAYAYHIDEGKADPCRSMEDYANEHGTPAQRFYNILCIAYGADTKLFDDIVSGGYLPETRAEYCEEEYEQVQDAFDELVLPHIDLDLAEEIQGLSWLREPEQ